jgi:hypothetical protein
MAVKESEKYFFSENETINVGHTVNDAKSKQFEAVQ